MDNDDDGDKSEELTRGIDKDDISLSRIYAAIRSTFDSSRPDRSTV